MTVARRVTVVCGCGWQGRRTWQGAECWHEYPGCACAWGRCPKCHDRLSEAAYVRRLARLDAEGAARGQAQP